MRTIKITKGCDIPIAGPPVQEISDAPVTERYAFTGSDYLGLKPTFHVAVGDRVRLGQLLCEDKKNPGVKFTSPCGGVVESIRRGEKRAFLELVLRKDTEDENPIRFSEDLSGNLSLLPAENIKERLVESGLWTALRTRPFSRIPSPATLPNSLFVTAIDTNPLAADPTVVIKDRLSEFQAGLQALSPICGKHLYLCVAPGNDSLWQSIDQMDLPKLERVAFQGPHPAGLAGTHIHFLDPVGGAKTNWYIGYQDVIAIGKLFQTGELDMTRVVALAGPKVKKPRLVRTRLGACLGKLTEGELNEGPHRVISGSVLNGRTALGTAVPESEQLLGLGRYHTQISVVAEMVRPQLFGWVEPGFGKYSVTRIVASSFLPKRPMDINTSVKGGHRAIFPVNTLDDLMPLDILPIFLCRALEIGDIEQAEALGALELDEEDLALCTFADVGKNDFGASLRNMLSTIAKEEQSSH